MESSSARERYFELKDKDTKLHFLYKYSYFILFIVLYVIFLYYKNQAVFAALPFSEALSIALCLNMPPFSHLLFPNVKSSMTYAYTMKFLVTTLGDPSIFCQAGTTYPCQESTCPRGTTNHKCPGLCVDTCLNEMRSDAEKVANGEKDICSVLKQWNALEGPGLSNTMGVIDFGLQTVCLIYGLLGGVETALDGILQLVGATMTGFQGYSAFSSLGASGWTFNGVSINEQTFCTLCPEDPSCK